MRMVGLPTLKPGRVISGSMVTPPLAVGHIDLRVGAGDGVLHHHRQELGVERIFLQRELGGEPALIADDGVEAAVRHRLRLVVELLAHDGRRTRSGS